MPVLETDKKGKLPCMGIGDMDDEIEEKTGRWGIVRAVLEKLNDTYENLANDGFIQTGSGLLTDNANYNKYKKAFKKLGLTTDQEALDLQDEYWDDSELGDSGPQAFGYLDKKYAMFYQAANGLGVDGIIGPNTYKKMGIEGPYASCSVAPITKVVAVLTGKDDGAVSGGGGEPIYMRPWFQYSALALFIGGISYGIYKKRTA